MLSKLVAVFLLPIYTAYLTPSDYGAAEVLLASVVAYSIFVRLGIIEALLRFYYRFDAAGERDRVVRSSFALLLVTSTTGALRALSVSASGRPSRIAMPIAAVYPALTPRNAAIGC